MVAHLKVFLITMTDGGPSSEPSACPEIPTVENAEVSPTSLRSKYDKGDSLMFNCQPGFVGRVTFICDGQQWKNTRNSKCSRKCTLSFYIDNIFVYITNLRLRIHYYFATVILKTQHIFKIL